MSLSNEFFEKRRTILDKYQEQGYIDLDTFMSRYSLTIEQLQTAGFIRNKPILSTAELYEFDLTSVGKNYIKEVKSVDLFLIKPDCSPIIVKKILDDVSG